MKTPHPKKNIIIAKTYEADDSDAEETPYNLQDAASSSQTSSSVALTSATIALFGAHGKTGGYFLKHALNAAYNVRILIPQGLPRNSFDQFVDYPNLKIIRGELQDERKVKQTLKGAKYVVCMMNDTLPTKKDYPVNFLTSFLQQLYPLMKTEPTIEAFLFQATSLANDVKGQTPTLSKIVKVISKRRSAFLQDLDSAIQFMSSQHTSTSSNDSTQDNDQTTDFAYIVTRPSLLMRDGPQRRKKLKASKSQPGPFPLHHVDLADFTLAALTTEKLRNSCPYVVKDTF